MISKRFERRTASSELEVSVRVSSWAGSTADRGLRGASSRPRPSITR